MKKLFLILILLLSPAVQANQSPPIEILAIEQSIDCGRFHDHLIMLRIAWESDKKLMKKGIRSFLFFEDWKRLRYFEDLFLLSGCRAL